MGCSSIGPLPWIFARKQQYERRHSQQQGTYLSISPSLSVVSKTESYFAAAMPLGPEPMMQTLAALKRLRSGIEPMLMAAMLLYALKLAALTVENKNARLMSGVAGKKKY